jgi:superfamily I DNA and/or RNA helicase
MEAWINSQKRLLEIESNAETVLLSDKISSLTGKQCESEGLSVLNLDITSVKNALFGRCCLSLEKIAKLPLLVGFKVGEEVSLVSMANDKTTVKKDGANDIVEIFGLVKMCNQQFIEIVVDDYDDSMLEPPYRLNLRPSMKTHEKMMQALTKLARQPHPLFSLLHRKTENNNQASLDNYLIQDQIKIDSWANDNLNLSQKQAVECCLNANLVGVIHGPVRINLFVCLFFCLFFILYSARDRENVNSN